MLATSQGDTRLNTLGSTILSSVQLYPSTHIRPRHTVLFRAALRSARAAARAATAAGTITPTPPVGPARYCSPRHRMPYNSRSEG